MDRELCVDDRLRLRARRPRYLRSGGGPAQSCVRAFEGERSAQARTA